MVVLHRPPVPGFHAGADQKGCYLPAAIPIIVARLICSEDEQAALLKLRIGEERSNICRKPGVGSSHSHALHRSRCRRPDNRERRAQHLELQRNTLAAVPMTSRPGTAKSCRCYVDLRGAEHPESINEIVLTQIWIDVAAKIPLLRRLCA